MTSVMVYFNYFNSFLTIIVEDYGPLNLLQ